jgi:chromosome partitioning protein
MQVIAFACSKGGPGKSTLTAQLGIEIERQGDGPVALIDADMQGTLSRWWNRRPSESPALLETTLAEIPATLAEARAAGIGIVLIDTPGAMTPAVLMAIREADLVVVPVNPSPNDLDAVDATIELVERLGRQMVFVLTRVTPRTRIAEQAVRALSAHGTVAPVNVCNRTGYPVSMVDGRTVQETEPGGAAAGEMRALWHYLRRRLRKQAPAFVDDAIREDVDGQA